MRAPKPVVVSDVGALEASRRGPHGASFRIHLKDGANNVLVQINIESGEFQCRCSGSHRCRDLLSR